MNSPSQKPVKKAVFFLRHAADTDHLVPVIHKWMQHADKTAEIVVTSRQVSLEDPRLCFVRDTYDIPVHTIFDLYLELIGDPPAEAFPSKPPNIWISRAYRLIGKKVTRRRPDISYLFNRQFLSRALKKLFDGADQQAVVFDPVYGATYQLEQTILDEAQNLGIKRVCLPHSNDPHLNLMFIGEMLNLDEYNFENQPFEHNNFDRIAFPNSIMADRNRARGVSEAQSAIIGCARYNREWVETLTDIYEPYEWAESNELRKILVLPRAKSYPIFWDELTQFIRMALKFENVCVIIMDHVRGKRVPQITDLKNQLTDSERKRLRIIGDSDSVPLILWCDIVLDLMTGVAFDAVRRKKPVLALDCLQTNKSAIGTYITASHINDRDTYFHTIESFSNDQLDLEKFYDPDEFAEFVRDMIEQNGPDVLGDYVRFIEDAMDAKDVAPTAATLQ
jgi:hypothetical protein